MKKTIAIFTALLILVSSVTALDNFKNNITLSYAHEIDNMAGKDYTKTSLSNAVRLQYSNESFVSMNVALTAALPYKDNVDYKDGEMGKIKGKQPFKFSLIVGPQINLPINEIVKIYTSAGLKVSVEQVNTKLMKKVDGNTVVEDREDLMTGIGVGGTIGCKIFSNKKINMIVGSDISCDLYRAGTVVTGYVPNLSISYTPYIGVGFTF